MATERRGKGNRWRGGPKRDRESEREGGKEIRWRKKKRAERGTAVEEPVVGWRERKRAEERGRERERVGAEACAWYTEGRNTKRGITLTRPRKGQSGSRGWVCEGGWLGRRW